MLPVKEKKEVKFFHTHHSAGLASRDQHGGSFKQIAYVKNDTTLLMPYSSINII